MQYLQGFNARRTVHTYVDNDREVLIFLQTSLMRAGAYQQSENYMPIIERLNEDVRLRFSPHICVVAVDSETHQVADEFSNNLYITVEPSTKLAEQ